MLIDPRLNEIDDALYRVALRALIVQNGMVLLVKENDGGDWWAIPGGGIDHGETVKACLARELAEELGLSATAFRCDLQVVHYNIGKVVNGVPRMNLFYRVAVPKELIKATASVETWGWFTKSQFLALDMNPSYDKAELVDVIFS